MRLSLSWIAMRARDSMMMEIMPNSDMSRDRRSRDSLTRKRGLEPEKEGELVLSLKMKNTLKMMR